MKICILGGMGQLGYELKKIYQDHEVFNYRKNELDITDQDKLYNILKELQPNVVVNAAAITDIDLCEEKRKAAFNVNTKAAKNIAEITNEIGSELVHISTDYVFDGNKLTAYDEYDIPNPINVYGLSKYKGEEEVKKSTNQYYIVRVSWLYSHRGYNFINSMLNLSSNHTIVKVVNDQRGSPTYSFDVAYGIKEMIRNKKHGIYHLANKGSCTWYELALEVCKLKNIKAKILPINSNEIETKARRPKNTSLNNNSNITMRPWNEALKSYLSK
ncbi:dTDP-4-dehydrorhamnose reductase [Serpentinicella sp. ANB-PHB4]|uniref:dTDP-4-dehydrorhamnose reductase n=1 Tax=Serpentinicella sp. ANB-PHB4 TaxID=3074076 RepID=UPI00285EE82D|nr:dTDP-4-dehydrorhamnose reductase [Serpentinicella sp. ANB-PHB4]MDR5658095.1 dTDP-4-dehydrorhamnose reductase [Serpentinicella sp. ANB-PHB4]